MTKYHDSGTVCTASVRSCPLGVSEDDHIEASSQAEFQEKLAEKMSGQIFGSISRSIGGASVLEKTQLGGPLAPRDSPYAIHADENGVFQLPRGTQYGTMANGSVVMAIPAEGGGYQAAVSSMGIEGIVYLTKNPRKTPDSALKSSDANPIVTPWAKLQEKTS